MYEYFVDTPLKNGEAIDPVTMWLLVAAMGVVSMAGLAIYNKFMLKGKE